MRSLILSAGLLVSSICVGQDLHSYSNRTWTAKRSGATITARFVRFNGTSVVLRKNDGKEMAIAATALVPSERKGRTVTRRSYEWGRNAEGLL